MSIKIFVKLKIVTEYIQVKKNPSLVALLLKVTIDQDILLKVEAVKVETRLLI